MEAINHCVLEELSLKHKDAYFNYYMNYNDGNDRLTEIYLYDMDFDFERVMALYNEHKSEKLDEECEKINTLRKTDIDYKLSETNEPRKIYLLKRIMDGKIIGVIDIHCHYDSFLRRYSPEITYEIVKDERKKGYGKMLLEFMLNTNNLDIDKFSIRIHSTTEASIRLINKFDARLLGITHDYYYSDSLQHYELNNPAKKNIA